VSQSEHDRAESEARGAELREELAITDERRAEEEEAKAEEAVAEAQQEESKKERKRREAHERREAAAAEAEKARAGAAETREQTETLSGPVAGNEVSGAAVASPGRGDDPKALAAASGPAPTPAATAATAVEGPEKPELYVAAAFAGAFLFARILKKIAE
jgi:hypothetical protein